MTEAMLIDEGDCPELAAIIRERINRDGPLCFDAFMELCLYHPQYGYYMGERMRIGKGGDFFTSSSVHAVFGRLLARQLGPGGLIVLNVSGRGDKDVDTVRKALASGGVRPKHAGRKAKKGRASGSRRRRPSPRRARDGASSGGVLPSHAEQRSDEPARRRQASFADRRRRA